MLEVRADERTHEARCPFCRALVLAHDPLWICSSCATVHHRECARENGACTTFGCGAPVSVVLAETLPPVEKSPRAVASSFQDALVLAVCLPIFAASGAGIFAQGLPSTSHSSDGLTWLPPFISLLFVVVVAMLVGWARRRDRGEEA